MSVDWNSFALPERAALAPGGDLSVFLAAHRTVPVRLDAGLVRQVDTLLVQYLVAAGRAWAARGLGFELTGVGARLAGDFARIGLTAEHLVWREAKA